jgi:metallo-beta-lactamase family protein
VHGETESARALERFLAEKMQLLSYVPRYGDTAVFHGRNAQIIPGRIVPVEPAVKELQDILNEMDNGFSEYRQRLEQMVAADAAKMPAVMVRLDKIRRFINKTLNDL